MPQEVASRIFWLKSKAWRLQTSFPSNEGSSVIPSLGISAAYGTNMPAQGTNSVIEGIYYPDYTPRFSPQYIPLLQVTNELGSGCPKSPDHPFTFCPQYIPLSTTSEVEGSCELRKT